MNLTSEYSSPTRFCNGVPDRHHFVLALQGHGLVSKVPVLADDRKLDSLEGEASLCDGCLSVLDVVRLVEDDPMPLE
jgi:hypothetical protein